MTILTLLYSNPWLTGILSFMILLAIAMICSQFEKYLKAKYAYPRVYFEPITLKDIDEFGNLKEPKDEKNQIIDDSDIN